MALPYAYTIQFVDDEWQEVDGSQDDKEDDDWCLDDQGNPAAFISIPGYITEQPRSPYKASDPEWIEYIRVARNDKLRKGILDDATRIALHMAHRAMPPDLRPTRVKTRWLDTTYPLVGPPIYMQQGYVLPPNRPISFSVSLTRALSRQYQDLSRQIPDPARQRGD